MSLFPKKVECSFNTQKKEEKKKKRVQYLYTFLCLSLSFPLSILGVNTAISED